MATPQANSKCPRYHGANGGLDPFQIPGLTVPLGHLPVVLIAVFISQIVHEFGHAIAAAV